MRKKEARDFERLLEKHGLSLSRGGSGHYRVMRNGKYVGSISHSPSDPNSRRQSIRDLVKSGYLPESAKRAKV